MALLNRTDNFVSTLISTGADAMSNLYYVQFEGDTFNDVSANMTVRATNITIPTATHATDSKSFMTISADFPKPELSLDKTVTVTFRVDSNYDLYKRLLKQRSYTSNPGLGFAANTIPGTKDGIVTHTFNLSVKALKQAVYAHKTESPSEDNSSNQFSNEDGYKELYRFTGCWISEISPLEFGYDSVTAQNVTVTIKFCDFVDPQNANL